jgi:hypothetical protein
MRQAPPVPSTAVYSTTDGVAHWSACIDSEEDEQTENVRVPGSHCGLGHNPLAVYVIADRLAQPEGRWRPFDRSGWRGLAFPPPARSNGTSARANGNGNGANGNGNGAARTAGSWTAGAWPRPS